MIGVIERIKNSVLLKCSTLNEKIISKDLIELIDEGIYHFAEDLSSLLNGTSIKLSEEVLRNKTSDIIKSSIVKKIKRKLFIDSLALQITNDSFIEEYVEGNITIDKLEKTYIKDLKSNKNSNQLNMTEDLNLSEIIEKLRLYVDKEITSYLTENAFLVNAINSLLDKTKKELEDKLQELISSTDNKYLKILTDELKQNTVEKEKGEDDVMMEDKSMETAMQPSVNAVATNKFEKYDDMTLFNKVILSLNTKEEKLYRKEMKLEKRKDEVDERLTATNKNIEANIERENKLSQRKLELNSREVELNSKLSEAEVIFLNIKPLIKGLNKIKVSDEMGGNDNE